MSKPNPVTVIVTLVVSVVILGGLSVAKGGLFIAKHEGDTLHLLDIVLRMAHGQTPHIEFSTPIGAWAFAPIAGLMKTGLSFGPAFIWAQVIVAAVLAIPTGWAAATRLSPGLAIAFCVLIMATVLALVDGGATTSNTVSMHYNRWAWAVAFVAVLIAYLPPMHLRSPAVDGVLVGVLMASLAMIKVTYFVAFAGPVFAGLVLNRQARALPFALGSGALVALVVTASHGMTYWLSYLSDLQAVANSENRAAPGMPLRSILAAPSFGLASILTLMSVILLRQGRTGQAGILILILFPAGIYVTFQNFGNDPQWWPLLVILLLAMRPDGSVRNGMGWDIRGALGVCAAMILAMASPSAFNMLYSPFRHFNKAAAAYTPVVPDNAELANIGGVSERLVQTKLMYLGDDPGQPFAALYEVSEHPDEASFAGRKLPACLLDQGLPAYMVTLARDLTAAGYGQARIYMADLLNPLWLYGDFEPLTGVSPWYYGGLPGLVNADFVLVADCAISETARRQVLTAMIEAGLDNLPVAYQSSFFKLYRLPGGSD